MKLSKVLVSGLVLLALGQTAQAVPGEDLYNDKCAKCHGKTGDGQGRSGRSLKSYEKDEKVMSFLDKAKMSKFTDEQLFDAIKNGGTKGTGVAKENQFSKDMEAYKSFTDAEIKDLISYIKTFAK